jgi:P-type Ca2+ transporter type 2C
MNDFYRQDSAAVLRELDVQPEFGLTADEAARRLKEYGTNELVERGIKNPWLILWEQLTSSVVVVLMLAAVVSALLNDYKDALAIVAIIILNAALGFSQEYRAEKAIAALKKLAVPSVRVRRDAQVISIPAAKLVPGDIVILEAGDAVAADSRVLESVGLQTLEAALTGESEPIEKIASPLEGTNLALGDRRNVVYLGTYVTAGRGLAVVTATGMRTELGHIAAMIQTVRREPTPLQTRLQYVGKILAGAALFFVALIFLQGLIRGESLRLMFLTAVSIGVAAIPEGLPAVVTIALALGAQRMLKRKALIRKLPAVETLGSVTTICSDKTGTLTENRMRVVTLQLADYSVEVKSNPASQLVGEQTAGPAFGSGVRILLAGGALCNDAHVRTDIKQSEAATTLGDPTEIALVSAAADAGLLKPQLEQTMPRVAEVPFTSERKRMTTIHTITSDSSPVSDEIISPCGAIPPRYIAFTKGAVDHLLDLSAAAWINGTAENLSQEWRAHLVAANESLARKGMRVIGLAFRCLPSLPAAPNLLDVERDLTFVGMFGLIDPPRQEAAAAVATCRKAGIRPVMITGDHPLTARSVAESLGIPVTHGPLTGPELDNLSANQLKSVVTSVSVYARVSPAHKLKIVEALQENGEIVSMTGDGVNDAPALKKADIGVAMGITGTDVAKEAADMVLLDDNFATIVAAVEEGRVIYANIRKFIKYILATNSGEISTMLLAPLLKMPLPLLPLQILWMNLVTDGLPALALGVEPAESETMSRPPYSSKESIFARGMGRHIVWVGFLMAFLSTGVGYGYWRAGRQNWQTMLFTTLTFSQMAHVLAIRSERKSLFQIGLLSNSMLLAAVSLTVALQLGVAYVPFLQRVFGTTSLSAMDLSLSVMLSAVIFGAVELEKWIARRGG